MFRFRGKTEQGEWVEGYVFYSIPNRPYIIQPHNKIISLLMPKSGGLTPNPKYIFEVIPESIGMSTGLKDKNGKEIFGSIPIDDKMSRGGDITKDSRNIIRIVEWFDGGFIYRENKRHWILADNNCEIIGNQFDNPDLLEKEE
jgi:uncharacterized phage protein (TIGR01671 family)